MSAVPAHEPYQLDAFIDRGHFGEVYKARHTYLGREVALKLVRPLGDPDEALAEARKGAALADHPNVVKVHDAGFWHDGRVFIASDLCEESLEKHLGGRPMDPAKACTLLAQAARGLSHIHHAELLHLDLRPANIMLGAGGLPKITDFGLAKWGASAEVEEWYTPHAAPEFYESRQATQASDVYALAMTLAHLLTGGSICRPFPNQAELLVESVNGDWPRLDELGSHVPPRIRRLIAKATEYDPDRRHRDVDEFKRELDRATPTISLLPTDDDCLASPDGVWMARMTESRTGTYGVEVKRNGRRRGDLCVDDITLVAARRQIAQTVKALAEGRVPQ